MRRFRPFLDETFQHDRIHGIFVFWDINDLLALNGKPGSLHQDVELFAAEQKVSGFSDIKISLDTTIGGNYGCIEARTTTSSTISNGNRYAMADLA